MHTDLSEAKDLKPLNSVHFLLPAEVSHSLLEEYLCPALDNFLLGEC